MLWTHAHASTTTRPRTVALFLMHAVQIAHARRAILVRDEHLADDAVVEHRDLSAFLGRGDVDVGRVVLRDHVTSGHAVAAEVARRPRIGRNGERRLAHVDQVRAERSRRTLQDLVAALQRDRRQEHAVGQILETVPIAAQTDFPLDRLVVRGDVLVVDRPVFAGAFERAALEVALAESQRHRIPQHRLSADAAASLRVEPFLPRPHRRNLTRGEVEGECVRVEVGAGVDARTALDDGDADAAPRKMRRQGAARRAGSDDDDVKGVGLHDPLSNRV